jgi:tRNA(Leu) C34 or U34 (ribose-2'-O)-methylase TrmL
MKYLLFLNRFEQDKSALIKKLASAGASIISDELGMFLVKTNAIEKCLKLNEVSGAAKVMTDWIRIRAFNFDKLKKDCLLAVLDSKKTSYMVRTKFHDKTRFSSRAVYKRVNPFLKKKGFSFDEKAGLVLYVEFKSDNNETFYRVSYSFPEMFSTASGTELDYSCFAAVLENPSTVVEVSDFLRLCRIFRIPLYIVTRNREFNRLLLKAKQETKGIDFEKMKIQVSEKMPEGYFLAGFSKLAKKNEADLKKFLSEKNQKIALVFGSETFGLTQHARDRMQVMFRLTPETKKPMRASHALGYVLGMYTAMKL